MQFSVLCFPVLTEDMVQRSNKGSNRWFGRPADHDPNKSLMENWREQWKRKKETGGTSGAQVSVLTCSNRHLKSR